MNKPLRAFTLSDDESPMYIEVKDVGRTRTLPNPRGGADEVPGQEIEIDGEPILLYAFWKLIHRKPADAMKELEQNQEELDALRRAVRESRSAPPRR